MKRLWIMTILFVCIIQGISAEPFTFQKDFEVRKGKKVQLGFIKQQLQIVEDGRIILSVDYDTEVEETWVFLKEELKEISLVEMKDYNGDGYTDFSICVAIGYGGLNTYRDYYFYDVQKDTFLRVLKSVSNLEKKDDMLFTSEKSSSTWYFSSYKFKNNIPYRYTQEEQVMGFPKSIKEYDTQGNLVNKYWEPNTYKVTVPKLYLSNKVYIIEGDKVTLLDVNYQKYLVKIAYQGKKKSYTAWVNFNKLLSEEERMNIEIWSDNGRSNE